MKKSLIILVLFITSISFFSCQSRSGHLVAEKKKKALIAKQDSINLANEAEKAFKESLIVEGSMWLDGTHAENSPCLDFGISFTGGPTLSLWLMEAHNLNEDKVDDNQVPLNLALEVRDVMRECNAIEMEKEFIFEKHPNGRVECKFTPTCSDPLDACTRILDVFREKKGWSIRLKNNWKTA